MNIIRNRHLKRCMTLLLAAAMTITCTYTPVMAQETNENQSPITNYDNNEELEAMAQENEKLAAQTDQHIEEALEQAAYDAATYDASGDNAGPSAIDEDGPEDNEPQEPGENNDSDTPGLFNIEAPAATPTPNAEGFIEISNAAGLRAIVADSTNKYKLTDDIDLEGAEWTPISAFAGTFDGNGHTISNFRVTNIDNGRNGGLFDVITGTVQDLTISGATVGAVDGNDKFIEMTDDQKTSGYLRVAALAAILDETGIVTNCRIESSSIYGSGAVGAMFGISRGSFSNCVVNDCNVYGCYPGDGAGSYAMGNSHPQDIGGLCGWIQSSSVENNQVKNTNIRLDCSKGSMLGGFAGEVGLSNTNPPVIQNCTVDSDTVVYGNSAVGGFIGYLLWGTTKNCASDALVSGKGGIGGFVGQSGGSSTISENKLAFIKNCSASGNVTANMAGGGFVGSASNSTITGSYATGDVNVTGYYTSWSVSAAGGFAGLANGKAGFDKCYATGDITAKKGAGGFIGVAMIRYLYISAMQGIPSRDYPHEVDTYGGISECYASGDVVVTDQFGNSAAGGFAGQLQDNSVPVNCYATGDVSGYKCVGGFAGSVYDCGAIDSYASGTLTCDTDTAGGFAGYISRGDCRTVCFTNCVYDEASAGASQAIGERNSNLTETFIATLNGGSSASGEAAWPKVNPTVDNIRAATAEEMTAPETYTALDYKYGYVSCEDFTYKEISDTWDFDNVWAMADGTTPYLVNLGDGQVPQLSADSVKIAKDGTATVTLDGYAGTVNKVSWEVSGTGKETKSDNDSITVKATDDGIIKVSVLLDGVKKNSISLIAGTGGVDGMTAAFVVPAPAKGGMSAYCVSPDATLQVKLSESVNTSSLNEITLTRKYPAAGTEKTVAFTTSLGENNTVIYIKPNEKMADGTTYTLSISGVQAASGKALAGTDALQFTTRSFAAPTVTAAANGSMIEVTADYVNNIKHYDSEGEALTNQTDTAQVYIVARAGRGARNDFGGDVLDSETLTLSVNTGNTASVAASLDIPEGTAGTVYIDVYTWDGSGSYMAAEHVVKTVTLQ